MKEDLRRSAVATMTIQPELSRDLDASKVARYLLALDAKRPESDVTQMKLQKLLYLVQASYLAATELRMFRANVEAFAHGPVVYAVLKEYETFSNNVITPHVDLGSAEPLPEDAREFIDAVWKKYENHSPSQLRSLTHSQAPWKDAYRPGEFRKQIADVAMSDYFRNEVPIEERVLHPNVVVVDREWLDELDANEDELVARAVSALS